MRKLKRFFVFIFAFIIFLPVLKAETIYVNKNGVKISSYTPMAPPQKQDGIVGVEYIMNPKPIFDDPNYKASGKLEGKVAIITGGGRGIGYGISTAFAKEGANLVLTGRTLATLEKAKEELEKEELYEVEIPLELPKSQINLIYMDGRLTKADKKFINEYLKK